MSGCEWVSGCDVGVSGCDGCIGVWVYFNVCMFSVCVWYNVSAEMEVPACFMLSILADMASALESARAVNCRLSHC